VEWLTTSTILERLRHSENGPTWDDLFRRFRPSVLRFARRMGLPRQEAEDVAQETLMAFSLAYRNGRYVPAKGRLSRWLFGFAWKQIQHARWHRMAARRRFVHVDSTGFWRELPSRQSAGESWDDEWELTLLRSCQDRVLQEVSAETYRAFELVVYGGQSPSEAATELGTSVKAVYNAKHRVLKRIRELRAAYEVETSEADHDLPGTRGA